MLLSGLLNVCYIQRLTFFPSPLQSLVSNIFSSPLQSLVSDTFFRLFNHWCQTPFLHLFNHWRQTSFLPPFQSLVSDIFSSPLESMVSDIFSVNSSMSPLTEYAVFNFATDAEKPLFSHLLWHTGRSNGAILSPWTTVQTTTTPCGGYQKICCYTFL